MAASFFSILRCLKAWQNKNKNKNSSADSTSECYIGSDHATIGAMYGSVQKY